MNDLSPAVNKGNWCNGPAAFWSLVAALPFFLFPLIHDQRWGAEATGLTTYDLPYYAANARAILDRGHWGFYPNPFDSDAGAPVIYFHWLMLALAGLMGPLGMTPGRALLVIQVLGALASARIMFALVSLFVEDRWRTLMYLLTMWGGGLLVIGKLISNLTSGLPWNDQLLGFDPGQGLWCLNFGRNLVLPTEAVYHALMMGMWLAILRQRWSLVAVLLVLITTTHPFTGAQALTIVGAWMAVQMIAERTSSVDRRPTSTSIPRWFVGASLAIASAFVGYYFLFLPRFPQHQALQHTWTLGWTLTGRVVLLAYGPAAVLAWMAVRKDPAWRRRTGFLIVAAGVSFLLANHQWFITPRQPIHFTRGYIWTPLWLAGLPTLCRFFDAVRERSSMALAFAIGLVGLVAISDNVGFLAANAVSTERPGFGLTTTERTAFAEMRREGFRGVLLTDNDRLGYLAAVYTSARPWIGHKYNTPNFDERQTRLAAFKSSSAADDILQEVDAVLTDSPIVSARLQKSGWSATSTTITLVLWRKP